MNIFKISYKVVRENNDEIYKGFGFKHHSNATQYYVHPNNQSSSGTTTLCQPIGEAFYDSKNRLFSDIWLLEQVEDKTGIRWGKNRDRLPLEQTCQKAAHLLY